MTSKSEPLAVRRRLLAAQCAEQRAQISADVTLLRTPSAMGGTTGYVVQHKKAILTAAGVGVGILLTKPAWVVGAITAALSAYKLAQKVLPVLGWRKFEVH